MKISVNWLKQYININTDTVALGDMLTSSGLEVEGLETIECMSGVCFVQAIPRIWSA